MTLDWLPHEALGPFHLGSPLESANGIAMFVETPTELDETTGLRSFVTPDGAVRLEVRDDGMIASVSATRSFVYRGRNLIGRSLADVQSLLALIPDDLDEMPHDGGTLAIADFVPLGLQLVLRDGRVAAATCY